MNPGLVYVLMHLPGVIENHPLISRLRDLQQDYGIILNQCDGVRHFPPLPFPFADAVGTQSVAFAMGGKQLDVRFVFPIGDYLFDLTIWLFIIQIVDYLSFSIPQKFLTEGIAIPAAHVVAFLCALVYFSLSIGRFMRWLNTSATNRQAGTYFLKYLFISRKLNPIAILG